jgi:hypothetical protein
MSCGGAWARAVAWEIGSGTKRKAGTQGGAKAQKAAAGRKGAKKSNR